MIRTRKERAREIRKRTFAEGDLAGEVQKANDDVASLTDALFGGSVYRSYPTDGPDQVLSPFAPPPPPDLGAEFRRLFALAQDADKNYAIVRPASMVAGTPTQAADSSFAANVAAVQGPVLHAPAAPTYAVAPVGKNITGPGLTVARRLEIQAEVARDVAVAVHKAFSAAPAKPVAKAGHVLRIVPKL